MDCYLVKFEPDGDYVKALHGGPWFINQQFLFVRKWESMFQPSLATITTMAVWVQILELSMEYYDPLILQKIGMKLGKLLRIDTRTSKKERGRFARICIQIQLDKPFISEIKIGGEVYPVLYEGLGVLCFVCGKPGH